MSDKLHLRWLPDRDDALRWLGALFAVLVALALPAAFQGPEESVAGRMLSAEILTPGSGWRPVDLRALKLPKGQVSLLRARFDIAPAILAARTPLGLYLSGGFSADAAWNGTPIGTKGRPGASASTEVPGPVDAVLPLPAERLDPKRDVLMLRLSAERLDASRSVIHGQGTIFGLRVAPFSADARRPVGYYAAPLLMSGVLLLSLVLMASRRELRSPGAAILAGLLICAAAELSRSVIDYPYPLQALRMSVLKAGAATLAIGCVWLALESVSWRAARPWRVGLAGLGALVMLSAPAEASRLIFAGALAGGLIVGLPAIRRRDGEGLQQAAALLLMAAFPLLPRPDYMDQGLYAASAPLIVQLLWRPGAALRRTLQASPVAERLVFGPAGSRRFVDPERIQAIQAAGDYVEISLANGRRFLEAQALSGLAERLPPRFLRVHRSHIVNLAHAQELRAEGGGRHRLRIGDDLWVPVSRTRVAEVRQRLGC
ncbi:LytTR family DNA-binding domain-containing protein [Phenylobacterium sp.]|uniref:LytTR family DNA-binding domain-containing protein n=1 Tax=Phenylobacterium sp. TaxID=1871053 RepID=UPI002F3FE8A4